MSEREEPKLRNYDWSLLRVGVDRAVERISELNAELEKAKADSERLDSMSEWSGNEWHSFTCMASNSIATVRELIDDINGEKPHE